jgi:hypothetical protein
VAENSWPFTPRTAGVPDAGSVSTNGRWEAMMLHYGTDGVYADNLSTFNDGGWLPVTAAPDTLAVDLGVGSARVAGHYYENTAVKRLTVPTAHATLDRYDHLVLRLTRTANGGSVLAAVVAGTPGANTPPQEVWTTNVREKRIATWRTPHGSGLADSVDNDFPERYLRPETGPLVAYAIGGQPVASKAAIPIQEGTRQWFQVDDAGTWWEFVFHYGRGWCIMPGQILASKTFRDGTQVPRQSGPVGIGSVGASGEQSARLSWNRPQTLPGHGFRYHARANIVTGVGGNSPAEGDLLKMQMYAEVPFYQSVGWPAQEVLRDIGQNYNPTIRLDEYVPGTDNALGVPVTGASTVLTGFLPTGTCQFIDGQFTVTSE